MSNYLIVGAGLFGATAARLLTDAGERVHVIERREHIAGNCYDEQVDGFRVNRYGGHIFHTNSDRVWAFVNRFADWRQYEHRVKACYAGRVYSLPPNLATFDQIGVKPGAEGERIIKEMFFDGYTLKQWGRPISEVPQSVIARVPIRYSYDDRYFTDRYQGLPENGYTDLVRRMLYDIPVDTGADFLTDVRYWSMRYDRVIYTGPLDALFNHELGRLEYRSLEFKTRTVDVDSYQGCATVNYTDASIPWTRILEWRHFGWQPNTSGKTLITVEYPRAQGEPYYPVNTPANQALHQKYTALATTLPWLRVGGRLGNYQYLNMDQAIAAAMRLVEREASNG